VDGGDSHGAEIAVRDSANRAMRNSAKPSARNGWAHCQAWGPASRLAPLRINAQCSVFRDRRVVGILNSDGHAAASAG
jgi:hypothetical protein